MGHPQTPSQEVHPDKVSMGSCEKHFFAHAPKSSHGSAKFERVNLVFFRNCSMLVLKFEILIQNHKALIAV